MVSETAVFLGRDNLINKDSHDKFIAWNAALLSTPGGQQYWEGAGQAYSSDAVGALNDYASEHSMNLDTVYDIAPFLRPDAPLTSTEQG